MRTVSRILSVLVLAGCASSQSDGSNRAAGPISGDIRLSVDRSAYETGAPIALTLTNRSPNQIGYNLCNAVLERRFGSDWQESSLRPTEACTMELRVLVPNESATYLHAVPNRLPAGEYRMRTRVEAPLGRLFTMVTTQPFVVQG